MSKSIGYPKGRSKGFKKKNTLMKGKNTKKDMDQNKKIISMEKKIRVLQISPELKWLDEYSFNSAISSTGIVFNLFTTTGIVQGIGPNNRIGNSVTMTSLLVKAVFLMSLGNVNPTRIRVLIVLDKEFETVQPPLGGAPTSNAILDTSVVGDLTLAPRNFNYIDRYKILYDKVSTYNPLTVASYNIGTGITAQVVPISAYMNVNLKLKHKIQYKANTGLATDLTGYVPLLYMVSDRGLTVEPTTSVMQRVYFKDS